MKIFKIVAVLLVILSLFLELIIFSSDTDKQSAKPLVSVSTFSLYDITKHIAKESIEIVNILPFGVDPHNFELTPKIMAKIERSTLVLYSGAGLEPWIEKISFSVEPIDMSKYVSLRQLEGDERDSHEHHDEHCSHGELDPHYWLDFDNMKKMARVISNELIAILPKNKVMYEKNRDTYIKMLNSLDSHYKTELKSCKIPNVILNHNSLGYLADRYDFHVHSLSGLSPEAEPTASDIKRVLQEIHESGISTIFYESFVNDKVIQSISKDSKVGIEVLHPLGNITGDEASLNASYESLMLQNLEKLTKAMLCN
ncbi:zinc ABC transporter substrate-binding protein [Sulfurimonas sp. SAG-AH-194-C21]|nr:metal ABC transporter substrate-binding protein [Sulfurimonas sp. SAG-AH-194-C21]MDF1883403.1 zinc ABC transporter substrate-binding protein [Sulfurimonas sp. SAG-AH-194-C21]